jgi:hypothetical protein
MTNPQEKYQVYKTGETPKQAAERQVQYFQQIINSREFIRPKSDVSKTFERLLTLDNPKQDNSFGFDVYSPKGEKIYNICRDDNDNIVIHDYNLNDTIWASDVGIPKKHGFFEYDILPEDYARAFINLDIPFDFKSSVIQ